MKANFFLLLVVLLSEWTDKGNVLAKPALFSFVVDVGGKNLSIGLHTVISVLTVPHLCSTAVHQGSVHVLGKARMCSTGFLRSLPMYLYHCRLQQKHKV